MMPKPLDFKKVEALRKHMLLSTSDMAGLLGVSRMTYYSWVKGASPHKANDLLVRAMLKKLLGVMTDHNWPTPEVIVSSQPQRVARLREILNK